MYNLFIVIGLKIMYILGGFLWKTSKSWGTWDGKTLSLSNLEGQLLDPSNRADGFLLHLMETGECATDLLPPEVSGVPEKVFLRRSGRYGYKHVTCYCQNPNRILQFAGRYGFIIFSGEYE